MKKMTMYLVLMVFLGTLFSCTKEETRPNDLNPEKATLSFGSLLNDMVNNRAAIKQQFDEFPDCSDGIPAYVEVALSQDGAWAVGNETDPLQVDLNPNPDDYDGDGIDNYFTEFSYELELDPGDYVLEYFKVFDDSGNELWIAPRSGNFDNFVDNALPLAISLGAGVKKYVSVDVVCFDNRIVNEYGYLFFDINGSELIEFCVFGNFCEENGRHFPAHFSVNVWHYSGDSQNPRGEVIVSDSMNNTGVNGEGDFYADPLCITLPSEGNNEYYFEITLLESDEYDAEERLIRSGVISDEDIRDLYDGDDNTEYYHFMEGNCGSEDAPALFDMGNGQELEPEGPAPEWGPSITDPMLVVIEQLLSYDFPPLYTLSAEEARMQPTFADAYMDVIEEYNIPVPNTNVSTTNISIPVEGGAINGRIYTPDSGREDYPVIVYYHGGGWVIAGIDTYDASIRALANKADAIVVAVGYRQAPEYKFPTAHNDAYAAYLWTLDNADSFNGNNEEVAVVGESAGGNLAAGVSIMARNNNQQLPVHQALIYPIANYDFDTPSYIEYQNAVPLNRPLMMWFFDKYLNSPAEGDNPLISLVDADLTGLPSSTVISAQIDPLQSEGQQLAQELQDAGVETTYELYIGVTHEFFGMGAVVPQADEAQDLVAAELREAFNN
ncbi:alpha/beta hydrolase [Autumnicola edwardsiae]|uniref:Alpha/beta hydrolase n=1 Tax=Autumnicola edwardsiae TaxID=3075594 RepID=A0ABU3CSH5_9FLAO|nr:alpha/beta hydrolase [Zunongwangia sp. F297]MDT0649311.1 alpha/beta hydrolase [Zunongwangia sp. F297]